MPVVSDEYLTNRKNKIAGAARSVFADKGYSAATMKDVMDAAKISRGGLYAHFENIKAVFIATLKYDDAQQIDRLLVPDLTIPLLPQLLEWSHEIILTTQNPKLDLARAKSEFFLSHDMQDTPYLFERYQKLSKSLKQFLSIGIKKGEFIRKLDIDSFTELLISMIDGILLQQQLKKANRKELQSIFTVMDDMLRQFLVKKGA